MKYADIVSQTTPQSEPLDERQAKNNAGGYVYTLDAWKRLDRFLILGSDAPTYYQAARALTLENAKCVRECYAEDAARTVKTICDISWEARAPKNDAAIFALAIGAASPDEKTRQLALSQLPRVCRTATHLFQFVKASKALGKGFGRAFKRAIAAWYTDKPLSSVAYQAIKYRAREGYTHKRLLDMSHAPAPDIDRKNLYHWIKGLKFEEAALPAQVRGHLAAMKEGATTKQLVSLIGEHKLPWEALPTEANAEAEVWKAMLPHLGLTALIRNLGNMTRLGAITPLSDTEREVVKRITEPEDITRSRIHPFAILQAASVYGSGHGFRGAGMWTPSQAVMYALDQAFYMAFSNVPATGKRHLLALDVSGSMGSPFGGGVLTCRDATAALALVTMSVEENTHLIGFSSSSTPTRRGFSAYGFSPGSAGVSPLNITKGMRLQDAIQAVSNLPFGGTDCALPMIYALKNRIPVDCFTILTDNETWAGAIHPTEALRQYRKEMGIDAKLVVVGMTATGFSIADPNDGGMLDVVGFDTDCPALIADFARGE